MTTVAMVVTDFPTSSETFIVEKFSRLVDAGIDAHLICAISDPAAIARLPTLAGIVVGRLHVVSAWPPRGLGDAIRAGRDLVGVVPALRPRRGGALGDHRTLRRLVRWKPVLDLDPDVVHVEFGNLALQLLPVLQASRARVVVSFRGYDANYVGLENDDSRSGRFHYDPLWPAVDVVHTLGADLERRIRARGCPAEIPIVRIPPAVDTARFAPGANRGVRDGAPRTVRLLSVGRLHWKKGHQWTLVALERLLASGRSVQARIVGEGPHRASLEAMIAERGLQEVVELTGACAHEDLIGHLRWADLLLHSAISEGFCNAVVEAQAMGLPVVCSDADGLAENVDDGVTGIVVPRRDPVAMADAVARLIDDPDRRSSMGAAGRTRAIDRFDVARQIDRFVRLYESMERHDSSDPGRNIAVP